MRFTLREKQTPTTPVAGFSSYPGVTMPARYDAHISRRDAAHLARVDPHVISLWATQGWKDPDTGERRRLDVADRDWRGRPLYRYSDVVAAEAATRNSARGRPRTRPPAAQAA